MKLAIVGCGNIASPYAKDLRNYPEIELVGAFDLNAAQAAAFGATHGVKIYDTLDALLADPAIGMIVNLTSFRAHYDVSARALRAGKHVYSEKPVALTYADARDLIDIAAQHGVRLGCSPFTLMGEAPQTAWREIRAGRIGTPRVVYAEVNHGRIESWHPAPEEFYKVGPMIDVGVYPLAIVTAMFGAATRVQAYGATLMRDRTRKDGVPYTVASPDFIVTMLELASGVVVRLTTNFYVGSHAKQGESIEFHGDAGSLFLPSWFAPNGEVFTSPFQGTYESVPLVRAAADQFAWGQGVWDMVTAIATGRPHRCSAEHAAHMTDVLAAVNQSIADGRPVALESHFTPPAPMDWAAS